MEPKPELETAYAYIKRDREYRQVTMSEASSTFLATTKSK